MLQQWSYACGGNGAHGARVMLESHDLRDLPKAWAYFDASIGHDRSKCIWFEAYANEAALRIGTGHHAGPRYTDADTRTEWLNEYIYQLNVNNGYEGWIYGIKRYSDGRPVSTSTSSTRVPNRRARRGLLPSRRSPYDG